MTIPARKFIEDVHARLALTAAPGIQSKIGANEWSIQCDCPAVKWRYGAIRHEKADKTGGPDAPIGTEIQTLVVAIWAETEDDCLTGKNNVLRAARFVAGGGSNCEFGSFDWITENKPGWLNKGHVLQGTIAVRLQIPIVEGGRANRKARITSQTHTEELTQQVAGEPE